MPVPMSLAQGRCQSQKSQWAEDCKEKMEKQNFCINCLREVAVPEAPDLIKVTVGSDIIKYTKWLSLQMQAADKTQKFIRPL